MSNTAKDPNKPDSMSAFLRGAGNGAVNGAIMSAVFIPIAIMVGTMASPFLAGAAGATALLHIAQAATVMVLATTLFGGIATLRKENKEYKEDVKAGRAPTAARSRERTQETMVAVPVPVLADKAEGESSSKWRNQVGGSRSNSIEALLARGNQSQTSHVEALQNESRDPSRSASLA
jgi:hypothetical protein